VAEKAQAEQLIVTSFLQICNLLDAFFYLFCRFVTLILLKCGIILRVFNNDKANLYQPGDNNMKVIFNRMIMKTSNLGRWLGVILAALLLSASLNFGMAAQKVSAENGDEDTSGADISVIVTDSPDPFESWNPPFSYAVTVTNNSADTIASGVVVTDFLDSYTFFDNATFPCVKDETNNILTFSVGDINPGENVIFTINVGLGHGVFNDNDTSSNPQPGDYTDNFTLTTFDIKNTVVATALTPDSDLSNNTYIQPTNVLGDGYRNRQSTNELMGGYSDGNNDQSDNGDGAEQSECLAPVPELPAAALLGLGLTGIGAFILIKRRQASAI